MLFTRLLPAAFPIAQPFAFYVTVCMYAMAGVPPKRAIIYYISVFHNLLNVFVMSHHDQRPSR